MLVLCLVLLGIAGSAAAEPAIFPFQLPASAPNQLRQLVRSEASAPTAHERNSFYPSLDLESSDGLRLRVLGFGSAVVVVVDGRSATTAYLARGTVEPGRMQASFGKLGEIAVGFRPAPNHSWAKPHRRCRGAGRLVVRRGVFVGRIRFRSENGLISIDSHRAKGAVRGLAEQCRRGAVHEPARRPASSPALPFPELEFNSFLASWRHDVSSASVSAIALGKKVLFAATAGQSEGGVAKLQFAFASAPARSFSYDDALTRARLDPPAPFVGTGVYRAAPDGSKTWTGRLAVKFPDGSRLPLTGPEFDAALDIGFGGR
jgi:hypothetical protein